MAVTDSYATALQYRTAVDMDDPGQDAELLLVLTAMSRYLDMKLHRFFTQDAAVVTRTYDANGGKLLALDDIATKTGLIVTADLDGDYAFSDAALTIDTDFWALPFDAEKGSEARPWTHLVVHPTSSVLSSWPARRRSVQVAAKFGWPAVPGLITQTTIALARLYRDLQREPMTLTLQNVDSALSLSPEANRLIEDAYKQYGRAKVRF